MIKFFRRIRQNLIMENKTSKYLKYAIGEIILVVIGILIALQINNWNENRILKGQETEILKSFRSSIRNDLNSVEKAMHRYDQANESITFLVDYLQKDLLYHDSLAIHFGNINADWTLRIDHSVFESLKSKGFNLITNDILKQDIISFYSFAEEGLKETRSRYTAIIEDASKNIYPRHFDALWEPASREKRQEYLDYKKNPDDGIVNLMIPRDYESLKEDYEFLYFLKSLRNQQFWLIRRQANRINTELNSILNRIDTELSL